MRRFLHIEEPVLRIYSSHPNANHLLKCTSAPLDEDADLNTLLDEMISEQEYTQNIGAEPIVKRILAKYDLMSKKLQAIIIQFVDKNSLCIICSQRSIAKQAITSLLTTQN